MINWLKNTIKPSLNGFIYTNKETLQVEMLYRLAEMGVEVIEESETKIFKNCSTGLVFGELCNLKRQEHSLTLIEAALEYKKLEHNSNVNFVEKKGVFFYIYKDSVFNIKSKKNIKYDIKKINLVTPEFQLRLIQDNIHKIDIIEAFKLITTLLLYNSESEIRALNK